MHLNSNDIFSQIGLIVDEAEPSPITKDLHYKAFLEIELSEGQHEILQIKNNDDPHRLAFNFCKKHQLNDLATEVIERKIIQAKIKEQQNLSRQITQKQHIKTQHSTYPTPKTPVKTAKTAQTRNSHINNKQKQQNKKSENLSKNKKQPVSKKSLSKQKKATKDKPALVEKKQQKNQQKRSKEIGGELYGRGMIKMKMRQREYARMREQKEKQEINSLTFHPKINEVSAKIVVQFRRENGSYSSETQKQNKKQNTNFYKNVGQQMQECTFKPQINKVSQIILQNRKNNKDQYDHFIALYQNLQYKKSKTDIEQQNKQKQLFKPKINPKNYQLITQTFEQRLQKSLMRKKEIQQGKFRVQEEYTFQPKIGRAPKEDSNGLKETGSRVWWQQLYSHNIKKNQLEVTAKTNDQRPCQSRVNPNTNIFYENLVQKRINQVFETLDGDEDGYISHNLISIQHLNKGQLIFLMPLFEQIDDLQAVLDFSQFRKALVLLLQDADMQSRGAFLSNKKINVQQATFKPEINQKSKAIINSRINGGNVHQDLYDKGLKQLQKKQYKMQKQRAKQQQKQLQDCSFKPLINNSSKYYIDKVLGKKVNAKPNEQSLIN